MTFKLWTLIHQSVNASCEKYSARPQLEIKDLTKEEFEAKIQEQLMLLKQLRVTTDSYLKKIVGVMLQL